MLLFKIASCISGGDESGPVQSFNGRGGIVTLLSADVTNALGYTPLSQAAGDARYVLKTGDTMTGALAIGNGILVASSPFLDLSQTWNNAAVTFTAFKSNVTNSAAAAASLLFDVQQNAVTVFNLRTDGRLTLTGRAAFTTTSSIGHVVAVSDANTASAVNTLSISHALSAGTAAAGLGVNLDFLGDSSTTAGQRQARIQSSWTDATHATRTAQLSVTVPTSATDTVSAIFLANQLQLRDGTVSLPGLSFQGDTNTGIYRIGADNFGLSAGGVLTLAVATTGVNLTSGLAYQYNSVNVIRAQTGLGNYFFGPSGNLTMTGVFNTSAGLLTLNSNTTGASNMAFGYLALTANTTGSFNSGIGREALASNTTGSLSIANGYAALFSNTTGNNNVATGYGALFSNTTGSNNVAIGYQALFDVTTPATGQNTAIGYNTGRGITTGNNNTIIGANVTGLAAALSNNIIIADGAGAIRLQVDSSGNTTLAGTVATSNGTAALPAHTFSSDLDTGIYRIGANTLGVSANGALVLGVGAAALGFFATVAATPVAQQVSGANLTNNVTAGGTDDTIANYTDLVVYANDAAAIRNDIYQLARKLKQVNDALRAYGLLT